MNPVDKHLAERAEKFVKRDNRCLTDDYTHIDIGDAFLAGALSEREVIKGKLREARMHLEGWINMREVIRQNPTHPLIKMKTILDELLSEKGEG